MIQRRRWSAVAAFAWAATLSAGPATGAGPATASPFAACARPTGAKWSYDDFLCLYRVGERDGLFPQARARLRRLGAGGEEHPWATLVLAHATLTQDEPRALRLYEAAAEGFV